MQAESADPIVNESVATEPTQIENTKFIIYIMFILKKYLCNKRKESLFVHVIKHFSEIKLIKVAYLSVEMFKKKSVNLNDKYF